LLAPEIQDSFFAVSASQSASSELSKCINSGLHNSKFGGSKDRRFTEEMTEEPFDDVHHSLKFTGRVLRDTLMEKPLILVYVEFLTSRMYGTVRGRNSSIKQFVAVNIPRFDVFPTAAVGIQVFWDMTACVLVNNYRRFGRACCWCQGVIFSEMSVGLYQSALIHIADDFLP
jgi:hypothetical protein